MDGNPIYHFKVRQLNKCVRIVQEEAGTNKNILFSASINETELEENESADELVINLELCIETYLLAIDLIKAWILRDLTKFRMKKHIQSVQQLRPCRAARAFVNGFEIVYLCLEIIHRLR